MRPCIGLRGRKFTKFCEIAMKKFSVNVKEKLRSIWSNDSKAPLSIVWTSVLEVFNRFSLQVLGYIPSLTLLRAMQIFKIFHLTVFNYIREVSRLPNKNPFTDTSLKNFQQFFNNYNDFFISLVNCFNPFSWSS